MLLHFEGHENTWKFYWNMKRSNWRRWSIMAKAIIWLMIKLIECCLQKSSKTILPTFDYNNLFYWVSWKLLSKTHFETSLLHSVGNWKLFLYLEIQLIFYLLLTEARAELVREFLENWWMEWLKKLTFIICHIKNESILCIPAIYCMSDAWSLLWFREQR